MGVVCDVGGVNPQILFDDDQLYGHYANGKC